VFDRYSDPHSTDQIRPVFSQPLVNVFDQYLTSIRPAIARRVLFLCVEESRQNGAFPSPERLVKNWSKLAETGQISGHTCTGSARSFSQPNGGTFDQHLTHI
jgi:hypothetical protein